MTIERHRLIKIVYYGGEEITYRVSINQTYTWLKDGNTLFCYVYELTQKKRIWITVNLTKLNTILEIITDH